MPASPKVQAAIDESLKIEAERAGSQQKLDSVVSPGVMWYLIQTGDLVPPWWSKIRDRELHRLVKESNHLSGIAYLATTKLVNIPLYFEAREPTITKHVDIANDYSIQMTLASQNAQTIREALKRFCYDYLIYDNGGFLEIRGGGDPAGPISGLPTSMAHLDAMNCTRTSNPEFPVVYRDDRTGKRYKFHYSRIIFMSQQPSGLQKMNGVGFSAASRSFMLGQVLNDQLTYKLEKMGSRPAEKLVVGRNVDTEELYSSYLMAEEIADNLGFKRYGKNIFIGGEDIDVIARDLNNFDVYDEETGTNMAMYAMFYSWGLDIRDGWPIGGSKSGDQIANMKARGRLPADYTTDLKLMLDLKACPPYLRTVMDFQDDEEDQQRAIIQDIRSRRLERLSSGGTVDQETQRRMMLLDGELPREEFIRMQLEDGKLEDGKPLASLFFSTDEVIQGLTTLSGFPNPLIYEDNFNRNIEREIHANQELCMRVIGESTSVIIRRKATYALYALAWLEDKYKELAMRPNPDAVELTDEENEGYEEQEEQEEEEDTPNVQQEPLSTT